MLYKAMHNVNTSQHANSKLTVMHVYTVYHAQIVYRTQVTTGKLHAHAQILSPIITILTKCCYPQTSRTPQQAQELVSLAINHHAELIIPSACMAATQVIF